jgi:hypothetical protein
VDIRATQDMVQIFASSELIASHIIAERGKRTETGHYPPEKIAFHMRTPTWCRTRAAEIGPATVTVIAALLVDNALFRLRAAQGVLGLAQKYSPARLEAAATKAVAVGDPSHRTVKGILAAGTETDPSPAPTGDAGAAAHLHGPAVLFGNVVALPGTHGVRDGHRHDEHRHDEQLREDEEGATA